MPISNPNSRERGLRRVGFATRAVAVGAIALTGGFVALAAQASSGSATTTRPLSQTAILPQAPRDDSGASSSGSQGYVDPGQSDPSYSDPSYSDPSYGSGDNGGYADPGYQAPAPSPSYAPPVTSSGGS